MADRHLCPSGRTASAVYEALKLDVHINEIAKQAAEFKNLQDRFRQAARVTALGAFEDFKSEFDALVERLETVRNGSLTPPERCFEAAPARKLMKGTMIFAWMRLSPPRKR